MAMICFLVLYAGWVDVRLLALWRKNGRRALFYMIGSGKGDLTKDIYCCLAYSNKKSCPDRQLALI